MKTKRILLLVGVISVVTAAIFYARRPSQKEETAIPISQPVAVVNEYPYMNLVMADGSVQTARELPEKSILILYFPDCDHCQREATEIRTHLKAFDGYHLWFISTAPYTDIERFATDYKLDGHSNVHFVRTEMQDVMNTFGGIPTPSVYIYSESKKLVKAINGETPIDQIMQYL